MTVQQSCPPIQRNLEKNELGEGQQGLPRGHSYDCLHLYTCTMCFKSNPRMAPIGRPVAMDSARARPSAFCSTRSANLERQAARWGPIKVDHGPRRKASSAMATARSMSALLATGMSSATTESSTGFRSVSFSAVLSRDSTN